MSQHPGRSLRSRCRFSRERWLGGSVAGPPVDTMPAAGQTGLLGLGQSVDDWLDDGGLVESEPVASHGSELGERGHQGGLGGHDAGGHAGGDGGVGGREREPANRTPEAVAGLDELPKQQLSVAGPAASVDAHRVILLCVSPLVVCCLCSRPRLVVVVVVGRGPSAGWWGERRACSSPSTSTWRPAVNRWSRLSTQTCSPRATRAGKRSGGSDRKNSCSWVLIAVSRTRCSLTEVRGLLTAKPMV